MGETQPIGFFAKELLTGDTVLNYQSCNPHIDEMTFRVGFVKENEQEVRNQKQKRTPNAKPVSEMFPWLPIFCSTVRLEIKTDHSDKAILSALRFYIRCIRNDMHNFIRLPNRCFMLAKNITRILLFFKLLNRQFTDTHEYLNEVCELLSIYTTLELKYSTKFEESKVIAANRIAMNYDIHLRGLDERFILKVLLSVKNVFYQREIMRELFKKYLNHKSPWVAQKELPDDLYTIYLASYKYWKTIEESLGENSKVADIANAFMRPSASLRKNTSFAPFIPSYKTIPENATKFILCEKFSLTSLVQAIEETERRSRRSTSTNDQAIDLVERCDGLYLHSRTDPDVEVVLPKVKLEKPELVATVDLTDESHNKLNNDLLWLDSLVAKFRSYSAIKTSMGVIEVIEIDDEDNDNEKITSTNTVESFEFEVDKSDLENTPTTGDSQSKTQNAFTEAICNANRVKSADKINFNQDNFSSCDVVNVAGMKINSTDNTYQVDPLLLNNNTNSEDTFCIRNSKECLQNEQLICETFSTRNVASENSCDPISLDQLSNTSIQNNPERSTCSVEECCKEMSEKLGRIETLIDKNTYAICNDENSRATVLETPTLKQLSLSACHEDAVLNVNGILTMCRQSESHPDYMEDKTECQQFKKDNRLSLSISELSTHSIEFPNKCFSNIASPERAGKTLQPKLDKNNAQLPAYLNSKNCQKVISTDESVHDELTIYKDASTNRESNNISNKSLGKVSTVENISQENLENNEKDQLEIDADSTDQRENSKISDFIETEENNEVSHVENVNFTNLKTYSKRGKKPVNPNFAIAQLVSVECPSDIVKPVTEKPQKNVMIQPSCEYSEKLQECHDSVKDTVQMSRDVTDEICKEHRELRKEKTSVAAPDDDDDDDVIKNIAKNVISNTRKNVHKKKNELVNYELTFPKISEKTYLDLPVFSSSEETDDSGDSNILSILDESDNTEERNVDTNKEKSQDDDVPVRKISPKSRPYECIKPSESHDIVFRMTVNTQHPLSSETVFDKKEYTTNPTVVFSTSNQTKKTIETTDVVFDPEESFHNVPQPEITSPPIEEFTKSDKTLFKTFLNKVCDESSHDQKSMHSTHDSVIGNPFAKIDATKEKSNFNKRSTATCTEKSSMNEIMKNLPTSHRRKTVSFLETHEEKLHKEDRSLRILASIPQSNNQHLNRMGKECWAASINTYRSNPYPIVTTTSFQPRCSLLNSKAQQTVHNTPNPGMEKQKTVSCSDLDSQFFIGNNRKRESVNIPLSTNLLNPSRESNKTLNSPYFSNGRCQVRTDLMEVNNFQLNSNAIQNDNRNIIDEDLDKNLSPILPSDDLREVLSDDRFLLYYDDERVDDMSRNRSCDSNVLKDETSLTGITSNSYYPNDLGIAVQHWLDEDLEKRIEGQISLPLKKRRKLSQYSDNFSVKEEEVQYLDSMKITLQDDNKDLMSDGMANSLQYSSYPSTPMLSIANFENMICLAQPQRRQFKTPAQLKEIAPLNLQAFNILPTQHTIVNNNSAGNCSEVARTVQTINILPSQQTIVSNNCANASNVQTYSILPSQTNVTANNRNIFTDRHVYNVTSNVQPPSEVKGLNVGFDLSARGDLSSMQTFNLSPTTVQYTHSFHPSQPYTYSIQPNQSQNNLSTINVPSIDIQNMINLSNYQMNPQHLSNFLHNSQINLQAKQAVLLNDIPCNLQINHNQSPQVIRTLQNNDANLNSLAACAKNCDGNLPSHKPSHKNCDSCKLILSSVSSAPVSANSATRGKQKKRKSRTTDRITRSSNRTSIVNYRDDGLIDHKANTAIVKKKRNTTLNRK